MSTPDFSRGCHASTMFTIWMLYKKVRFGDADWSVSWTASGRIWSTVHCSKFLVTICETARSICWCFCPQFDMICVGCRMQVSSAWHVRDELAHFTEVRRSRDSWLVKTFEDQTAQLVLNSLYDWKPVQLVTNDPRNVITFTLSWDDTSGGVQDGMKRVQVFHIHIN